MNYLARAQRDDTAELQAPVAMLIRQVAATVILPRFRQLRACDVTEKTPGEVVTVADRESEHMLTEGLMSILPDARVVGEEACASDPRLLVGLDKGLVWIVDPLDGTANFAAGREPFGIIIALAYDGVTIAAWLFNPVTDQMCYAALGAGATMSTVAGPSRWLLTTPARTRPIAALATQFMPEAMRNAVIEAASGSFELRPIPRCAAEHYPLLCRGENHVALFQRTLPWDHAAGALLLTEAGGYITRWDGSPYRFHDEGLGILAASSRELWDQAAYRLSDRCLSDVSTRPETHHIPEL
jgi:fructose-1,6-bisphosphatase/inositol monophosphatase family enzyme